MAERLKELETKLEQAEAQVKKVGQEIHDHPEGKTAELALRWEKVNAEFDKLELEWRTLKRLEHIEQRAAHQGKEGTEELVRDASKARDARVPQTAEAAALEQILARRNRRELYVERQHLAFRGWARAQHDGEPTDDELGAMRELSIKPAQKQLEFRMLGPTGRAVRRKLGVPELAGWHGGIPADIAVRMDTSLTAGGDTIPEGFVSRLERALLSYGGMRVASEILRTAGMGDLPWPTVDDTSNEGIEATEKSTVTAQDVATDRQIWKAFKYTSKIVKASSEILEDSAFDLATTIADIIGERIGRIENRRYTTGNGTTAPEGIVAGAAAGKTAASATAIAATEVLELLHSVDPAYRDQPGSGFMFSDGVLLLIRLLQDSTGNWIWQTDMRSGAPNTLWGKRVIINQHMIAAPATGQRSMLFGDLSKYKIRDHGVIRVRRADELYLETDEVGFVGFHRTDGKLLDAGGNPVKALVHP